MKKLFIILLFNLLSFLPLIGQEADEDSVWNLEDLDYGELEERTTSKVEESHGWFPISPAGMKQKSFVLFLGDNYEVANKINSKSFSPTTNPFSDNITFSDKERQIKKKNKDEFSSSYPLSTYGAFGFEYMYSTGFLVNLYGTLNLAQTTGLLYAPEPKKHFLNKDGKRVRLKEAGILYLIEWSLNPSVGIEIPIYGAFIKIGELSIHSYYYLTLGPSFDFVFWSGATQSMQIANVKSELRYKNGQDTLQIYEDKALPNINRIRYGVDVAIGWSGVANSAGTAFELFSYIPLSSVLDDAEWKQYHIGIRWKFTFTSY